MGNSKNKKVTKKRKASNTSCRNSSEQKENVPKNAKAKTIKPDPNNGIAMSKQLLMKKNKAQMQRSSINPVRICPNGKPLPSLSELEKMYEDSDDDDQTPITSSQTTTYTVSTTKQQTTTHISENNLLSPTTINKISERLLGSIKLHKLPDPTEILEATSLLNSESLSPAPIIPPKKRKKPKEPYIVGCKDRPKVMQKPNTNFCKGSDDYGVEARSDPEEEPPTKRAKRSRIPKYTKSIFNALSDEIAERLVTADTGCLSDASSDSNKTIEYDPILSQNSRPYSFSPLPSTSTDEETITKNDNLFNESLKVINIWEDSTSKEKHDVLINDEPIPEIRENDIHTSKQSTPIKKDNVRTAQTSTNTNLVIKDEPTLKMKEDHILIKEVSTRQIKDDVQVVEIPYDTIEIEDITYRTVGLHNTTSKAMDTNDIEIIEPVEVEVGQPKRNNNIIREIPDDEDCTIVTSSEAINNYKNLNEPIVIDDDYSTINIDYDSFNDQTPIETINVDDIIIQNECILDKWKTKINTIVDVPSTDRNVNTLPTAVTPIAAEQITSTPAMPNITMQAEVIPSTSLQNPSTSNSNNYPDMSNRNSATSTHSRQRQPTSASDIWRSVTFHDILDSFFKDIQNNARARGGNRSSMISRFQTPRPTSNSITTSTQPVNTHMPAPTNVYQNSSGTLQNIDNRQGDIVGSGNSCSHPGTQQSSLNIPPPSTAPTRNIGDCPICLDPLNSSNGIASTNCGHVFCLSCIQASVKTNGKRCPTCRKALKGAGGGYHQLYL